MHNIVSMDDVDPLDHLVEDIEGLINPKSPVGHFALNGVKVAHIAVLHNEEVPVTLCMYGGVPSKVL